MSLTRREFHTAQQRITSAWHRGDQPTAFAEINRIVRDGRDEMKAQALWLSGLIKQSSGNLRGAEKDWLKALPFAGEGTFLRHTLQHEIGNALETTGCVEDALSWYRAALATCATGDEFAANPSLVAFLRINGENIAEEDRQIVNAAIERSWRVLEVEGKPDLKDVAGNITRLAQEFSSNVDDIVKNS